MNNLCFGSIAVLLAMTSVVHADPDLGPSMPMTASRPARWLSLGVLGEPQHYEPTRGMWADVDLVNVNGWTLGTSLVLDRGQEGVYDGGRSALLDRTDVKAVAAIARTARFQRFELRGSLGAGLVRTHAEGDMMDRGMTAPVATTDTFPVAEAAARVTVPISEGWAITSGPTATYYDQYFKFDDGTKQGATHRLGELVIVVGVSYRL